MKLSLFLYGVAVMISAFAEFYSVLGLTAIFSGATVSVAVIGAILGIGKMATVMWLRQWWDMSPKLIRNFLLGCVVALSLLTNVGMFGFLSKAHSESSLEASSVEIQQTSIAEKIASNDTLIAEEQSKLELLQAQVERLNELNQPSKAEKLRIQQADERSQILKTIATYRADTNKLKLEAQQLQVKQTHIEADVGPIKYLAALVYGSKVDASVMDRSVQFLIIVLVLVIDPLAMFLVLAASWTRQQEAEIEVKKIEPEAVPMPTPAPPPSPQPIEEKKKRKYTRRKKTVETTNESAQTTQPETTGETTTEPETANVPTTKKRVTKPKIEPKFTTNSKQIIRTINKDEYVQHNGKRMHVRAVRQANPDLFISPDLERISIVPFSAEDWPQYAEYGDKFTRIDTIPHKRYEFNGMTWVLINPEVEPQQMLNQEGYIAEIARLIKAKWYKLSDFPTAVREQIKQQ